jgi:hypothetical protein
MKADATFISKEYTQACGRNCGNQRSLTSSGFKAFPTASPLPSLRGQCLPESSRADALVDRLGDPTLSQPRKAVVRKTALDIGHELWRQRLSILIGFSVALTAIIVMLAMIGLEVRKIDRQLAEIERLLSADDEKANG